MSNKIAVNNRRWKEGQKKVPATEEGHRKFKRKSEEGPGNRRRSKAGQKKVLATEEGQDNI